MKIINWVQRKIQGKPASDAKKLSSPYPATVALKREYRTSETSDLWPSSGLLAIGTFGLNKNLQKPNDPQTDGTNSNEMISTLSPEQVLSMYKQFGSMTNDGEHEQEIGPSSGAMTSKELKKESGKNYSLPIIFKKIYRQAFSPRATLNLLPESKTDKILRAILHRKIYPRSASATNHVKTKCLENKSPEKTVAQVKCHSKWIRTDSDYIVLEI